MRTIIALINKEFLQIIRNKVLMAILIIAPVIQLVVFVLAADLEVKNLSLGFIDKDNSAMSQEIRNTLTSSDYFILRGSSKDYETAFKEFDNDKTDVIIEIPANFERDVVKGVTPRVSVLVNAINSLKAGVASSYISATLSQMGAKISIETQRTQMPQLGVSYSEWYNPLFNYKSFMLPGILCVLITVIGVLVTSLNIVREKELGTIEQLNVTPITKVQFVLGKLLPFWFISMIQLTLGLLVSYFVFDLVSQGSLFLIYGIVTIYIFGILGIGFLVSTISETQSQAMFMSLFFMFLFILLSGLFTPIESMPVWAQKITLFNPTAYIVDSIRLIILKGSSFRDIQANFWIITAFTLIINTIVIWRYNKTS